MYTEAGVFEAVVDGLVNGVECTAATGRTCDPETINVLLNRVETTGECGEFERFIPASRSRSTARRPKSSPSLAATRPPPVAAFVAALLDLSR